MRRERTEAANLLVSVSAVNHTTYDDTSYYIMELSLSQILRSVPYSFRTLEAFRILSTLWSVDGCPL